MPARLAPAQTAGRAGHATARRRTRARPIGGRVCDRLTFQIKRRVKNDRDPGCFSETLDQPVIARALVAKDRLQAARPVDVSNRWQRAPLVFANWHNVKHVAGRMMV